VNAFMHSLFSQVEISLNGTPVTTASDTYAYRAYIETLLSYGSDAKESQLSACLFRKDKAGEFDKMDATNPGMGWRKSFVNGSRSVDMIGCIHADLFFQDRYILNKMNVKIKFIRNRDTFSLIEEHENRIIIESAILYVRKVKLSSAVFLAHAKALEDSNAKYPVRRVVCKSITVSNGLHDVSYEKLFSGQLPNRIIVSLVCNDAFSASKDHNPFNFEHYNVSEISVYADGQNVQNIKPLTMNFGGGQYV